MDEFGTGRIEAVERKSLEQRQLRSITGPWLQTPGFADGVAAP